MHKYGIDLEDGEVSGRGTRKMTRTQVTKLMGTPEGGETDANGNRVFTWRDQNRRKVRLTTRDLLAISSISSVVYLPIACVLCVSLAYASVHSVC